MESPDDPRQVYAALYCDPAERAAIADALARWQAGTCDHGEPGLLECAACGREASPHAALYGVGDHPAAATLDAVSARVARQEAIRVERLRLSLYEMRRLNARDDRRERDNWRARVMDAGEAEALAIIVRREPEGLLARVIPEATLQGVAPRFWHVGILTKDNRLYGVFYPEQWPYLRSYHRMMGNF